MKNREVIIGVSGGIAAFKTAALVSQLVQSGICVTVGMSSAALKFIQPATFAALTGREVATKIFDESHYPLGTHIELASRADLFCVAPASADFLAKCANGIADDLLTTLYLAFSGTVLFAPAMNCDMWAKAAVQRNVNQLSEDGVQLIGPDTGWLSCQKTGEGRMASPESISHSIRESLKTAQ